MNTPTTTAHGAEVTPSTPIRIARTPIALTRRLRTADMDHRFGTNGFSCSKRQVLAGLQYHRFRRRLRLPPRCPTVHVLCNERPRVEVNWHYLLWLDQLYCANRIVRAHGKVVTDRQDREINALLADQTHVAE